LIGFFIRWRREFVGWTGGSAALEPSVALAKVTAVAAMGGASDLEGIQFRVYAWVLLLAFFLFPGLPILGPGFLEAQPEIFDAMRN
jgi:hypothetical protein